MSTDRVDPQPEPGELTSEPIGGDLADDPTTERAPSGRTYDDETPAADLDTRRVGVDPDDVQTNTATGLTGLDTPDPGRHHV
jgi:hypothetical protein